MSSIVLFGDCFLLQDSEKSSRQVVRCILAKDYDNYEMNKYQDIVHEHLDDALVEPPSFECQDKRDISLPRSIFTVATHTILVLNCASHDCTTVPTWSHLSPSATQSARLSTTHHHTS